MLERLKTLSELYGVSGNEGRVRAYLRALAEPLADEVFIDPVGNLCAAAAAGSCSRRIWTKSA